MRRKSSSLPPASQESSILNSELWRLTVRALYANCPSMQVNKLQVILSGIVAVVGEYAVEPCRI